MQFDYKQRITTKIADHPLGKLLDSLKMETAFFTESNMRSPWAAEMPIMPNCMMFHIITEGYVAFSFNDQKIHLESGEFILFPKGQGHILSDGECKAVTPLHELPIKHINERYETLSFGGGGNLSRLICGVLIFQHPLAIKLLGVLPGYIRISRGDASAASIVDNIIALIASETQQIGMGAEAVISRLADILVVTAMRQYLSELEDKQLGWLHALTDERIGKSLELIHDNPSRHWLLEELAAEVGMSRASFAQQFKHLVGDTPMDYLTEWRMSIAYSKLQLSKDTALSIALDIGYQSEAAFSRAFKKVIGKTPGEVRKEYLSA